MTSPVMVGTIVAVMMWCLPFKKCTARCVFRAVISLMLLLPNVEINRVSSEVSFS